MLPTLATLALVPQEARAQSGDWYVAESRLQAVQNVVEDVAGPDGARGDADVQESYRIERLDHDGMTLVRYRREIRLIQAREEDRTWSVRWADLRGATLDREPVVNGALRVGLRFTKPVTTEVVERNGIGALPPTPSYAVDKSSRKAQESDDSIPITFARREQARSFLLVVRQLAESLKLPLEPTSESGPTAGTGF